MSSSVLFAELTLSLFCDRWLETQTQTTTMTPAWGMSTSTGRLPCLPECWAGGGGATAAASSQYAGRGSVLQHAAQVASE